MGIFLQKEASKTPSPLDLEQATSKDNLVVYGITVYVLATVNAD